MLDCQLVVQRMWRTLQVLIARKVARAFALSILCDKPSCADAGLRLYYERRPQHSWKISCYILKENDRYEGSCSSRRIMNTDKTRVDEYEQSQGRSCCGLGQHCHVR